MESVGSVLFLVHLLFIHPCTSNQILGLPLGLRKSNLPYDHPSISIITIYKTMAYEAWLL